MKVTAFVFGLASAVFLAGCSGNSENAAACSEANTKLTAARASVSELTGQENQIMVLADMAVVFDGLSRGFSDLANSSSGDVMDELSSAKEAASWVSETITSVDSSANEQALATFNGIVSEGGALDKACQAAGSDPFTTGW